MNALELKDALYELWAIPEPMSAMIWGPPGVGKSAIIAQAAKYRKGTIRDCRLLLYKPTDLTGLPTVDLEHGRARFLRPDILPDYDETSFGVLFFDEITAAAPTVQAAAYQVAYDHAIGQHRLPPHWRVVFAGNRTSDRGVAYAMPSPLANRMIHFDLEASLDAWKHWAYAHEIHPLVLGFLSFRPNLLFKLPEAGQDLRGFPTPRTWTMASQILHHFSSRDLALQVLSGVLGDGPAVEFRAFLQVASKLPDINDILDGSAEPLKESTPDLYYAVSQSLVSHLLLRFQDDAQSISTALKHFFAYLEHLPEDYAVLAVRDLLRNCTQNLHLLLKEPAFLEWRAKYETLLAS